MNIFYLVDWANIVLRILRPDYRKPMIMAFILAILKPIIQRYNAQSVLHPIRYPNCLPLAEPSFLALGRHVLARLGINGQVRHLERLLNWYYFSHFDVSLGIANVGYWIWIEDVSSNIPIPYIHQRMENMPLYIHQRSEYIVGQNPEPVYLYQPCEYIGLHDFVVHVPNWLPHLVEEMRAEIDKYRILGSRYKIEYY